MKLTLKNAEQHQASINFLMENLCEPVLPQEYNLDGNQKSFVNVRNRIIRYVFLYNL